MDRAEAARLLGVRPDASPDEVRDAFRSLVRGQHPDVVGAGGTETTALLIEANRTLRTPPTAAADEAAAPADRPPTVSPAGPVDARVAGDSLLVDAEPSVVMARLVEAGHALGDVTYLDRSNGIVEVLLQLRDPDDERLVAASLVASLEGRLRSRADRRGDPPSTASVGGDAARPGREAGDHFSPALDAVEVFCTVERLDGHPPPPIGPIVSALAAEVRLGSRGG
jgi:hypothetical protein